MVLRIQITKLKIHQYLLKANSPNLMLAKFSRYTAVLEILYAAVHCWRFSTPFKHSMRVLTSG